MGMPISIHLRGPRVDELETEAAVAAAFADLRMVDEGFSMWKPQSPVSRYSAGLVSLEETVAAYPLVGEVDRLCRVAQAVTGGWFSAELPHEGAVRYDPTGLVKGWAIGRAAAILTRISGHAYCINAGGDIAVGGVDVSDDERKPWRLGIEDPRCRGRVAHVVELWTGGIATSGAAARGAHIIDPITGAYVDRPGSVTVVAPSIMWADVWATALFAAPDNERAALIARLRANVDQRVIEL